MKTKEKLKKKIEEYITLNKCNNLFFYSELDDIFDNRLKYLINKSNYQFKGSDVMNFPTNDFETFWNKTLELNKLLDGKLLLNIDLTIN